MVHATADKPEAQTLQKMLHEQVRKELHKELDHFIESCGDPIELYVLRDILRDGHSDSGLYDGLRNNLNYEVMKHLMDGKEAAQ